MKHFIRHYVEMVLAMYAGMIVLGLPGEWALELAGSSMSRVEADAPAAVFLWMALIMSIPMVWLMRRRGHAWRPCWEMTASMFVPTFGAIAALATGLSSDVHGLMMIEHVAMLPAMLIVMLLRYHEYAGHHHHHAAMA